MPEVDPTDPPRGGEPPRPPLPVAFRQRVEMLVSSDHRPPTIVVGAAVALAVIVTALVVRGGSPPPPEIALPLAGGPADTAVTTTSVPEVVLVHAAGAVNAPGLYELRAGARVADLVDAAGGPAPHADLDRLNLAAPLADGQQVYVPRAGEPVPTGAVGAGAETADAVVDINRAGPAELEQLPGVGPALARAIVQERERRGGFRSVEDLLEVRGIGPAKLEQLRDLVTV